MVRSSRTATLSETAAEFGVSVPTCVRQRRRFKDGGLQALVPMPRGARKPSKVTEEILAFIEDYREKNDYLGSRRLVPVIEKRFGVRLHPRSITKAFERRKKILGPAGRTLGHDDVRYYRRWRRIWLSGHANPAIEALRHQGMLRSLHLVAASRLEAGSDPALEPDVCRTPDIAVAVADMITRVLIFETGSGGRT